MWSTFVLAKLSSAAEWLIGVGLAVALMVTAPAGSVSGAEFKVCKNQTYALCAAARCHVYNGVAYCQCEVKSGDSISLPFQLSKGEDVCSSMPQVPKTGTW